MSATVWYSSLLIATGVLLIGLLGNRPVADVVLMAGIAFLISWGLLATGGLLYQWVQWAHRHPDLQGGRTNSPSPPRQKKEESVNSTV
jgi:hypothetical protein|nr:MAG: hypothetical protein KatS3mg041_0349 [Bacteroidota bacterium]